MSLQWQVCAVRKGAVVVVVASIDATLKVACAQRVVDVVVAVVSCSNCLRHIRTCERQTLELFALTRRTPN